MAAKKEPGPAIMAKLHLADNGIDVFDTSNQNNQAALIRFLRLCTPSVLRITLFLYNSH